jgi:CRP-like cAMP-binding protein
MDTRLVTANISKHISLTAEEEKIFLSMLEPRSLKKKDFHLIEGEVCKYSAFVVDGALKGYTVDKDGKEHVLLFALADWWIADMYSLVSGKPGVLNIEALTDTEMLLLSREDQLRLFDKVPKFERFFRILVENSLVANHQRLINNLSLTAEERYLQFIKRYPAIVECAPQHSIASYLGITPEFLSKIRARLAKKP